MPRPIICQNFDFDRTGLKNTRLTTSGTSMPVSSMSTEIAMCGALSSVEKSSMRLCAYGVRFPQFRRSVHVVDPSAFSAEIFRYPRAVGVDYGISHHFAALWGALLPDGLLVVYRELYGPDSAGASRKDPRCRATRGTLPAGPRHARSRHLVAQRRLRNPFPNPDAPPVGSAAYYFTRVFGGNVRKARNDRVAGWALIDELLRVRQDGLPRLLISSACINLIRTLPAQMRSTTNPDDINTHGEDDLPDALRDLAFALVGRHGPTDSAAQTRPPLPRPITAGVRDMAF